MQDREIREIYLGGLFTAIGFVLPIGFHLFGLGAMFTPMLLPLFFLGFLVRLRVALSSSIITPLLSCFFTGMPPIYPPIILVVISEAVILSGTASLFTHNLKINFWATLISSIILGKITAITITALIAHFFHLSKLVTGLSLLIYTLPGIAIQIIVIPLAYNLIKHKVKLLYEL